MTFQHVTQEEMDRLIRQAQADTWKDAFAQHDASGTWPKYTPESLALMAEKCIKRASDSPQQYVELVQRLARRFNTTNDRVQMEILKLIP